MKAAEDKTNAQLAQNGQKTIKFQIGTHTALSGARAYPAFRTAFLRAHRYGAAPRYARRAQRGST